MKKLAPFLKLYTDYVKNFDKAMELVEQWFQKSPEFAKMIKGLQAVVRPSNTITYLAELYY